MQWPLSGAMDASFETLNRALFSVGTLFVFVGFAMATAFVLQLESVPGALEWPLTLAYAPMVLGIGMLAAGAARWHVLATRKQEFKNFVLESVQDEQTGTVEFDGQRVSIEAEIGIEENGD